MLTLQGLLGLIEVPEEVAVATAARPALPPASATPLVHGVGSGVSPVKVPRILVLDIETQRSAEEVGGWDNCDRMGLAVAVTQDLETGEIRVYTEADVEDLLADLTAAACIIGFNLRRFDFGVLRGYRDLDYRALPALDILEEVQASLGFRLSLNHLAQETLGAPKLADGLQSLRWWKAGEVGRIIEYCKSDVDLTRRLFEFGRMHGYLLYRDYQGRAVRMPVRFEEKILLYDRGLGYNSLSPEGGRAGG